MNGDVVFEVLTRCTNDGEELAGLNAARHVVQDYLRLLYLSVLVAEPFLGWDGLDHHVFKRKLDLLLGRFLEAHLVLSIQACGWGLDSIVGRNLGTNFTCSIGLLDIDARRLWVIHAFSTHVGFAGQTLFNDL